MTVPSVRPARISIWALTGALVVFLFLFRYLN